MLTRRFLFVRYRSTNAPLARCRSAASSSPKYGITVHPPLCEMTLSEGSGAGETKDFGFDVDSRIVLLFDDIKDQESHWLHSLVKGGLVFKELSFESDVPSTATSIYNFSVDKPNSFGPVNLSTVCEGKVAVIVNVASF